VHARKGRKSDPDYRKLRRALCDGYGNQLAERMLHHNGYHTVGYRSQLVEVLNCVHLSCFVRCNVKAIQKIMESEYHQIILSSFTSIINIIRTKATICMHSVLDHRSYRD
jgi:hypothetical protein